MVYAKIIQVMYDEVRTSTKSVSGETEDFMVNDDVSIESVLVFVGYG